MIFFTNIALYYLDSITTGTPTAVERLYNVRKGHYNIIAGCCNVTEGHYNAAEGCFDVTEGHYKITEGYYNGKFLELGFQVGGNVPWIVYKVN